jgi:hypothetical protein
MYVGLNCKSGRITYRLKYNLSNEIAKIRLIIGINEKNAKIAFQGTFEMLSEPRKFNFPI